MAIHRLVSLTRFTLALLACASFASVRVGAQQPQLIDVGGHKLQYAESPRCAQCGL
jgi:hypothetical protein